jgi:hypothetical protein
MLVVERVAAVAVAAVDAAAGCGGGPHEAGSAAATTAARGIAITSKLDGLDISPTSIDAPLRRAPASISPPVRIPGDWWTLRIDAKSQRLVIRHP